MSEPQLAMSISGIRPTAQRSHRPSNIHAYLSDNHVAHNAVRLKMEAITDISIPHLSYEDARGTLLLCPSCTWIRAIRSKKRGNQGAFPDCHSHRVWTYQQPRDVRSQSWAARAAKP